MRAAKRARGTRPSCVEDKRHTIENGMNMPDSECKLIDLFAVSMMPYFLNKGYDNVRASQCAYSSARAMLIERKRLAEQRIAELEVSELIDGE